MGVYRKQKLNEGEAFTKNAVNHEEKQALLPGGVMVTQRTLNPLFLVRVQAWEPRSR